MRNLSVVVVTACLSSGCTALLLPLHHPAAAPYSFRGPVRVETPPIGRWDLVMRLRPASVIDVLTRDGTAHVGAFAGASETTVHLVVGGADRSIERTEIIRVDLVDLPGSEVGAVATGAAGGALLGVGATALVAAVIGHDAWPPPGWLLRGGAAIGGVNEGLAALEKRRGRPVYIAPSR